LTNEVTLREKRVDLAQEHNVSQRFTLLVISNLYIASRP